MSKREIPLMLENHFLMLIQMVKRNKVNRNKNKNKQSLKKMHRPINKNQHKKNKINHKNQINHKNHKNLINHKKLINHKNLKKSKKYQNKRKNLLKNKNQRKNHQKQVNKNLQLLNENKLESLYQDWDKELPRD